jgi:hypothetical protein
MKRIELKGHNEFKKAKQGVLNGSSKIKKKSLTTTLLPKGNGLSKFKDKKGS